MHTRTWKKNKIKKLTKRLWSKPGQDQEQPPTTILWSSRRLKRFPKEVLWLVNSMGLLLVLIYTTVGVQFSLVGTINESDKKHAPCELI